MAFIHRGNGPVSGPSKDPDEVLWYGIAWDEEIAEGESIVSSVWLLDAGIAQLSTLDDQVATVDDTTYQHVNKILISGGEVGQSYLATNRVTLSDAQVFDRSMRIKVVTK